VDILLSEIFFTIFATPKRNQALRKVNPLSTYKTISVNKATATKCWYVVDADGQTLGRMSSQIAMIIRGKNKPSFTPHVDCGDNVIVINAEKVVLTGYPGGQRSSLAKNVRPEKLIEMAVKGMLPKNRLGRKLFHNLFVYEGTEHPHVAQQPKELKFDN
jgi:large subunit ribosomal protein L13